MSLSLIIDVESNLVNAMLLSSGAGSHPEVVYATSQSIAYKKYINADHITKMMMRAVEEIMARVLKEGILKVSGKNNISIKNAHYVLSSPWAISESKAVKIHYDKNVEITEKIIKDIVDDEKEGIIKKNEKGLIFIEQKIVDVRLNGYAVQTYAGKKTDNMEISFVLTLSPEEIVKSIHELVSKYVHVGKEAYHSSSVLYYMATRLLPGNGGEYVIVQVHGELSQIVIVKNGITSYFASFPYGTETLVKNLSLSMKSTLEDARSGLSMHESNKIELAQQDRLEKFFLPMLKKWRLLCRQSFADAGKDQVVPRKIYLSASEHSELFKKTLEEEFFEVAILEKSPAIYVPALKDML